MSLEAQVFAALNVAGVTALASTRIYPDAVPLERGLPALAFARVATEVFATLDAGMVGARGAFEVWCMAATRDAAEALADAAQTACLAAPFALTNRRAEFDDENETYSAVLSIDVWQ